MSDVRSNAPAAEGGLQAPTRHPIDWQQAGFWDRPALNAELHRVFDICHGCRRCVSLCHAFPTLFDLVDESETMEVDGVDPSDYAKVVEQCYLCDLCYQTKCPYVPPHEWNVDFPHLMLRAKAQAFERGEVSRQHQRLTNTTSTGRLASIPVVTETVNAVNRSPTMRKLVRAVMGVHPDARVPEYQHPTARARLRRAAPVAAPSPQAAGPTRGRVAVFVTCYGNYNMPQAVEDLVAVFRHNDIEIKLIEREQCCGMPKMEIGDLTSVRRYAEANLPVLAQAVREGWDITAPIPSCVLMFRQEIPLLFAGNADAQTLRAAIFDPFEYLMHRHRAGLLNTQFNQSLGKVAYHAPCHQRVQNIGPKTRELLSLIPDTQIEAVERCSGHDGTYGVRDATYERSMRIARPVVTRFKQAEPDHISSDCPMAGEHLAHGVAPGRRSVHPLSLLRRAYDI
jgi:glycerol-3-phosphate dehydrogenase subunit C